VAVGCVGIFKCVEKVGQWESLRMQCDVSREVGENKCVELA
jgi:hypothetical protein